MPENCRLLILGGGPAGTAAAREAARRRVRTALVLPGSAAEADSSQDDTKADSYFGQAVFAGRRTVLVSGRELRFHKAVIATGAIDAPEEIAGVEQDACPTPETLTQRAERPPCLAVIGTGPLGCQWAQTFRRLGSRVHLIGRERTVLSDEDPAAAALIQARLQQEDVRLHLDCQGIAIETTGNLRGILIEHDRRQEKLLVDEVLICGPRRANTAGLDLDAAGVVYTDRGILVNDRLQTANRHIFAAGAVCGTEFASPQAAEATARLAVHNALGLIGRRLSRLVVPRCIDTDPQLVQVGPRRNELVDRGIEIDSHQVDLCEAEASLPARRREGFIAVDVRRRTGRILGVTAVAEDAEELIAPLILLMTHKWPLSALADVIPCQPGRFELLTGLGQCCKKTRKGLFGRRESSGT